MRIQSLQRSLRAVILFLSGFFLFACGETEPNIPDPGPEPDPAEDYRAFTEETPQSKVKMSEETIFVKDRLSNDLEAFDATSGTITFRKSDLLVKQEIKVGDILYSTDRTEKTPDGYCLRVLSIKESGGFVTYETEPESLFEAIDYLRETNVLSAGNYKPEDIHVYSIPIDGSNDTPGTRTFSYDNEEGVEIKGDKLNFKSDGKETSFDIILWEDKENGDNVAGKFQVKLGIRVQHEFMTDNTESVTEIFDGNLILFTMIKFGVGVKLEIGTKFGLSMEQKKPELMTEEEKKLYERQKTLEDIAKANLVGKRFRLLDVPLNYTCTKVIIDPRFVVYGEFKLDLEGKLVVEAGVENGVYALNIENDLFQFDKRSYLRKVTNFQRYFRINSSISLKAEAGFGLGFNFEIPALPVKKDSYTGPSAIGLWCGIELSEEVKVEWKKDFLSGKTEIVATGEEGSVSFQASLSGVVGIKKRAVEVDLTLWPKFGEPLDIITIPGWTWSMFVSTPSPYDLQSTVEGASASLSWKVPIEGQLDEIRVYVGNTRSGEMIPVWKDKYEGTTALYGPAPDGNYRWYVETVSEGLEHYPSDIFDFKIDASTLTTGTPRLEDGVLSVPVEINTLNRILERGVVYSTTREEPMADYDKEIHYSGDDTSFFQILADLQPSKTYFARGYAKISYDSGSKYIYGNSVSFETGPTGPIDPSGLVPQIKIYPDVIEFGEVPVGRSKSATVEISNIGDANLTYSIVGTNAGYFSVSPSDSRTLWPGESQTVTVTFSPRGTGEKNHDFVVKSNDPRGDTGFRAWGTGVEEFVPITDIVIDRHELVIGRGDYAQLNLVISPENYWGQSVMPDWSVDDESLIDSFNEYSLHLNSFGFRGAKAGTTTVSATVKVRDNRTDEITTFTDECTLVVKVYIERMIAVEAGDDWFWDTPIPKGMYVGEKQTFRVKYEPVDATETDMIWKSDDPSVASVSPAGMVTALKPGSTTIRCIVATEARGHIEVDWSLEVRHPSGSHEGLEGDNWD